MLVEPAVHHAGPPFAPVDDAHQEVDQGYRCQSQGKHRTQVQEHPVGGVWIPCSHEVRIVKIFSSSLITTPLTAWPPFGQSYISGIFMLPMFSPSSDMKDVNTMSPKAKGKPALMQAFWSSKVCSTLAFSFTLQFAAAS